MNDRVFLDTNVLVYAFDRDEPAKRMISLELLKRAGEDAVYVLSTQILSEFYVVTTRKMARPLSESQAEQATRRYARFPVVVIDRDLILTAVRTSRTYQLSLWDALIIESAISAGCRRLLTEDLQHGLRKNKLVVENPYRNSLERRTD